jgi:hypothetical protein
MSDPGEEEEGASPSPSAPASPAEVRPTRMEEKEQRYGLILAGLCLAAIALPWLPKVVSGEKGAIWKFLLSLGTAIALGLAARKGHRVVGTFAAALAGIVVVPRFLPGLVTQFLCLVYAGWLMLRTNRAVRAANAARGRMTPAERAAARQQARETRAARRRGEEPTSSTGRKPAAASKRYTPPKKKKQPR